MVFLIKEPAPHLYGEEPAKRGISKKEYTTFFLTYVFYCNVNNISLLSITLGIYATIMSSLT